MSKKLVYLAGQIRCQSIDMLRLSFADDERFEFVSSAWNELSDIYNHGGFCRFKYDPHGRDDAAKAYKEYAETAKKLIAASALTIGVFDSSIAYGTLAEVSYSCGLKKPTLAFVFEPQAQHLGADECGEFYKTRMQDAYLFAGSLCTECHWLNYKSDLDEQKQKMLFDSVVSAIDRHIGKQIDSKKLLKCESPIETIYFNCCFKNYIHPEPQYQAGSYRLDFAFPALKVCVELDGHEFHKTKEQRTHDAKRERWLQLNGWRVIRFTGSEIHKDVASCVRQTVAFIEKVKQQNGTIPASV